MIVNWCEETEMFPRIVDLKNASGFYFIHCHTQQIEYNLIQHFYPVSLGGGGRINVVLWEY